MSLSRGTAQGFLFASNCTCVSVCQQLFGNFSLNRGIAHVFLFASNCLGSFPLAEVSHKCFCLPAIAWDRFPLPRYRTVCMGPEPVPRVSCAFSRFFLEAWWQPVLSAWWGANQSRESCVLSQAPVWERAGTVGLGGASTSPESVARILALLFGSTVAFRSLCF